MCSVVASYTWSQNVRRLDNSLLPRRRWSPVVGWPGGAGKEGSARQFLSSPLSAAQVEAWLEGLLQPLPLAGPAENLKNALLRRRLGCYGAHCV